LTTQFPANQLSEDAALKIAECDYNAGHLKEAIEGFKSFDDAVSPNRAIYVQSISISPRVLFYLEQFDSAGAYYKQVLDSSCEDGLKTFSLHGGGLEFY